MLARLRQLPPWAALTFAMVASAGLLLYLGRGQTFHFDEWSFVSERMNLGFEGEFLRPHNEHISIIPVLVYKVMLNTAGLDDHWLLTGLVVLMHLTAGLTVWVLARRRVGPWAAVIATVPILFLGRAYENLLWGFQIGFVGSVMFGLIALAAVDLQSRRGDLLAAAALTCALASSSLGIPFAVGLTVEIALSRRWRRLPVALVPFALYLLWYAGYGRAVLLRDSLFIGWDWALDASAAAVGALLGQGLEWGRPLAVALFALLLWRLARPNWITPRMVGLLAAGLCFWVLIGIGRAQLPPDTSRYIYLGAVIVLLAIVEGLRGLHVEPRVLAIAAGVVMLGAWLGLPELRSAGRHFRETSAVMKAELAVVELERARAPSALIFDPQRAPALEVRDYLAAVRGYRSTAAMAIEDLPQAQGVAREGADRVLMLTQPLNVTVGDAKPAGPAPAVEEVSAGTAAPAGSCVRASPAGPGQPLLLDVRLAGTVAVRAGAAATYLRLRRFADGYPTAAFGGISPGDTTALHAAPDQSPAPWHLRIESAAPVSACAAR